VISQTTIFASLITALGLTAINFLLLTCFIYRVVRLQRGINGELAKVAKDVKALDRRTR
jgi:hypothetical protein